jgi:beta-glucosidase
MIIQFPPGFLWGTATAAHQVEGNNVNSDLWVLEHLPEWFSANFWPHCR